MAGSTTNDNGIGAYRAPVAKTASYQVLVSDIATVFTNEGASGEVDFTLPKLADVPAGWFCEFFTAADQTCKVVSGDADKMIVHNDLAADSISFETAGDLIGNSVLVRANANHSKWQVVLGLDDGVTVTVAT